MSHDDIDEFPNNFAFDVAKHIYDLMILFKTQKIKNLLSNERMFKQLISYKRLEEKYRKGGIPDSCMISDFLYINQLLGDNNFRVEYDKMQDIYVFNEQDKLSLENATDVLEAIRNCEK